MAREATPALVADLIAHGELAVNDGYRAKNSELSPHGLPFARAANINQGFKFDGADRFPEEHLTRVGDKVSQPGDVVFTSKGTVGRFALVRPDTPRFVYSPQLCFWRSLNRGRIDPRWLFYWMQSREFFAQYSGVAGQTDMAEYVNLRDQRRMSITLPPIDSQRAIAHILGTLDDKIELNRRMNETLEAMAGAIFKAWFVDFDPVRAKIDGHWRKGQSLLGFPAHLWDLFPNRLVDSESGEIPQGWKVTSLGEVADIIDCLHSRKPERKDKGQPLLQLWNIRDDGLMDMSDTYYIDETDYRTWISRMEASPGDCVITNVGRVGAVAQMPEGIKAALGRNMTAVRCKRTFPFPTFLIQCLLSEAMREEIVQKMDTGTILDALNVRNIPKLRLVVSHPDLLMKFEESIRPLRARMERNLIHSRTRAALRGALLPKLISGELGVKDSIGLLKGVGV